MREPAAIDSLHNARVRAARALRTRKGRLAAQACLVEGPHAVAAAIDAGHAVQELFVTADRAAAVADLGSHASGRPVAVRLVTERVLDALAETVTPQGVVAVVAIPVVSVGEVYATRPRLTVVLDQVADPGNAGTVVRTADAAGAGGVVLTAGSTDVWSGKAVRASAGSVFHLPIVTGVPAAAAIACAAGAGVTVLATAADGDADLDDLIDDGSLAGPCAWVFGGEARGVPDEVRRLADRVVRIPLHGRAESLNLATAAAVCLYASAHAGRRALP
ncbi:MAG TPA: RNA methyltransferase [Mycobacteriales bacterium]|nr:RNA methyltransferase [Mycobacteriales bacterium]